MPRHISRDSLVVLSSFALALKRSNSVDIEKSICMYNKKSKVFVEVCGRSFFDVKKHDHSVLQQVLHNIKILQLAC